MTAVKYSHLNYAFINMMQSEEDTKTKKRSKKQEDKGSSKKAKKDSKAKDDNETSWELGGNKHVTVRSFKNKWFVDIREMYMDNNGEMKPGKKGMCIISSLI